MKLTSLCQQLCLLNWQLVFNLGLSVRQSPLNNSSKGGGGAHAKLVEVETQVTGGAIGAGRFQTYYFS